MLDPGHMTRYDSIGLVALGSLVVKSVVRHIDNSTDSTIYLCALSS
jgi:hypothetical protein